MHREGNRTIYAGNLTQLCFDVQGSGSINLRNCFWTPRIPRGIAAHHDLSTFSHLLICFKVRLCLNRDVDEAIWMTVPMISNLAFMAIRVCPSSRWALDDAGQHPNMQASTCRLLHVSAGLERNI